MISALILHIVIAVLSIAVATFVAFKPTITRLVASYSFILATVATGTYLVILTPSNMLHACVSGLLYLTVVSIITIATHVRVRTLAHQEI